MKKLLLKIQLVILSIYILTNFWMLFIPVETWNLNKMIGWGDLPTIFLLSYRFYGLFFMMGLVIILLIGVLKKVALPNWLSYIILVISLSHVISHFFDFAIVEMLTLVFIILTSFGILMKIFFSIGFKSKTT